MRYYKVLEEDGSPYHGGRGVWPLPRGKRPGKWLAVDGVLVPCRHGLHLCRRGDLVCWLGPAIWLAEADETELISQGGKVVVRRARLLSRLDTWNEMTARLFAADCGKDAVRRCRKAGIEIDPRVDECIRVVYRYARGEATETERLAAWSAAGSAARSAAELAAGSAARSAESAARLAAWSAAGSAAWLAAEAAWLGSAGGSAAQSAARQWQTRRLFEYLEGTRS